MYFKENIVVGVFVDHMLIIGEVPNVTEFKKSFGLKFKCHDFGEATRFLSLNISENGEEMFVHQKDYVQSILEEFGMKNCKGRSFPLEANRDDKTGKLDELFDEQIYRRAVGRLLYLSNNSRPDLALAVGKVSQSCNSPTKGNWLNVKSITRYLRQTTDFCLKYVKSGEKIECFTDADWVGDRADRKSISGTVVLMAGNPVIWRSKMQSLVALSTVESEYIAVCETTKEVLWLIDFLTELRQTDLLEKPFVIMADNQGAMYLSDESYVTDRTKHMELIYYSLKDEVSKGRVSISHRGRIWPT